MSSDADAHFDSKVFIAPGDKAAKDRLVELPVFVPAAELDKFVDDWAARLAAGPPIALSMTKMLLNAGIESSMEQALEAEGQAQTVNGATQDAKEAIAAFMEKRDPNFSGR